MRLGITWDTGQPPEPTFWMHQLPTMTGADGKFLLNPGRFSHELLNLLGKGDAHMAWEMAFKLHAKGLDDIKRERSSGLTGGSPQGGRPHKEKYAAR